MLSSFNVVVNPNPSYKFHAVPVDYKSTNNNIKKVHKRKEKSDWLWMCFVLSLLFTIQAILAVGSYSGEGKPPMFGDFEAQRHWMEVTYHLPIEQWYINGTDNDLLYWGLDYPPLTAYHSYVLGVLSHKINPDWVALHSSRGFQSAAHKLFMRATVIIPFIFIYFSALVYLWHLTPSTTISKNTFLLTAALYPGLIAMDCAHFQYNAVSLGFFLLAFVLFTQEWTLVGSIFFVLAVNYKQMELYHALPIFVFILARCTRRPLVARLPETIFSIAVVGIVVLLTFAILWFPFLLQGKDHLLAVVQRIFPFYRGLFEDKVASFWCSFSFILKLNRWFTQEQQIKLSTVTVLLTSLPSLIILFNRPTVKNFRYTLASVACCFFLFSFQVHEKSILLPAIAALPLLPFHPLVVSWFLQISNTSLFSLCLKDNNPQLLALFVSYSLLCHYVSWEADTNFKLWLVSVLSTVISYLLCLSEWMLTPPPSLPHIFPLLNALFSCIHFMAFLLFVNILMFRDFFSAVRPKHD